MRPSAASSAATSKRRVSRVTRRMSWLPTISFMSGWSGAAAPWGPGAGVGSGADMGGSRSVLVVRVGRSGGAAQDRRDLGRVGVEALRSAARQSGETGQQVTEGVDLAD